VLVCVGLLLTPWEVFFQGVFNKKIVPLSSILNEKL